MIAMHIQREMRAAQLAFLGRVRLLGILLLSLLTLAACQPYETPSKSATGGLTVSLLWMEHVNDTTTTKSLTAPNGVSTVRTTLSGPDMANLTREFDANAGSGTLNDLPAGGDRTLTVQGLDTTGVIAYEGKITGITILANTTTDAGTAVLRYMIASGQPLGIQYLTLAPGAACPNGGQVITVGYDTNADGKPDLGNVDYTVCDGIDSLISTAPATTAACPSGGTTVNVGMDDGIPGGTPGDGILQALEVTSTFNACNSGGAGGTIGINQGSAATPQVYDKAIIGNIGTVAATGTSYYQYTAVTSSNPAYNFDGAYTLTLLGLESELSVTPYDSTFTTQGTPSCWYDGMSSFIRCTTNTIPQGSSYYFSLKDTYGVPNQFRYNMEFGADEVDLTLPNITGSGLTSPGHIVSGTLGNYEILRPVSNYFSNFTGTPGIYSLSLTHIVAPPRAGAQTTPLLSFFMHSPGNMSAMGNYGGNCQQNTTAFVQDSAFGCVVFLNSNGTYALWVINSGAGAKYDIQVVPGDTVTPVAGASQTFGMSSWESTVYRYVSGATPSPVTFTFDTGAGTDDRVMNLNLHTTHPRSPGYFFSPLYNCTSWGGDGSTLCTFDAILAANTSYYLEANQQGGAIASGASLTVAPATVTPLTLATPATGQVLATKGGSRWFSFTANGTASYTVSVTAKSFQTGCNNGACANSYITAFSATGLLQNFVYSSVIDFITPITLNLTTPPAGTVYVQVFDSAKYGGFNFDITVN
ncbi:MAG: hypothetical protein OEW39_06525 [Deltaproteobacteria bacterium]|nr:hypothetical protein [Deltaproteobacteria bacterium]